MRVAIVAGPHIPVPPPAYGGTERVIAYLVRGLLEEGHEPILLASGDSQVECELIPIVDQAIGFPRASRIFPSTRSCAPTSSDGRASSCDACCRAWTSSTPTDSTSSTSRTSRT